MQEYYAYPGNESIYSDNFATDAYHMAMRQMEYEKNMLAKQTARASSARAEAAAATEAAKVERLVAKRMGSRTSRFSGGGVSHFTELELMQLEKYFMVVIFILVIMVVVNIGTFVVLIGKVGKGSGTMVIT